MKIFDAILISISYPIASIPVIMNDDYYCDGGLTSPYPTELIKKKEKNKTIGIVFKQKSNLKIESITDYITSFIELMNISLNDISIKRLKNNLIIYTDENPMNLHVNEEKKKELTRIGIKYAHLFLKKNNL